MREDGSRDDKMNASRATLSAPFLKPILGLHSFLISAQNPVAPHVDEIQLAQPQKRGSVTTSAPGAHELAVL